MSAYARHFRQSSILGVIQLTKGKECTVILYKPVLQAGCTFADCPGVNDLQKFKAMSHAVIANRYDSVLDDVREKVYARDVFRGD